MPAKQERYRKRKADQGFQRVELLVPEELVSHLKAYARALRDAHALGLAAPLFDGMRMGTAEDAPPPAAQATQPSADVRDPHKDSSPATHQPSKGMGHPKPRPDFSKGLLDD